MIDWPINVNMFFEGKSVCNDLLLKNHLKCDGCPYVKLKYLDECKALHAIDKTIENIKSQVEVELKQRDGKIQGLEAENEKMRELLKHNNF